MPQTGSVAIIPKLAPNRSDSQSGIPPDGTWHHPIHASRPPPWVGRTGSVPQTLRVCNLDICQYWDETTEPVLKLKVPIDPRSTPKNVNRMRKAALPPMTARNWPRTCSQKWGRDISFMKTRIFIALCVMLGAGFISARADDDTPEQAAARAALQQEMYALDHPQAQSSTNKHSTAAVAQPAKSTGKPTIVTVATYAVTPQTAPAATSPATAPTPVAPVAQTPVAITPAVATPATNATDVSMTIAPAGATPIATPVATTSISKVPVATTPEMAAALAAVQQKMYELNHPDTHSPPEPNSAATSTQSNEAAPHAIETASAPATTTTTTVTAPDLEAPAATPVAAAPATVPETSTPATPAAAPVVKTPVAAIPVTIAPVTVPEAITPAVVAPIVTAPATTAPVTVAPVAKAPVAATPATIAPVAAIPVVAHVAVAPVSVAPKAVAPAPELSTAPVVVAPLPLLRRPSFDRLRPRPGLKPPWHRQYSNLPWYSTLRLCHQVHRRPQTDP